MKSVRLAIVDDSSFVREGIVRLLSSEARIIIVGTAASGEELLENLDSWQPDCVTLDLNMPGMDGLETLDRLMEH
nr:response regulator [Myxococcota bacterium]